MVFSRPAICTDTQRKHTLLNKEFLRGFHLFLKNANWMLFGWTAVFVVVVVAPVLPRKINKMGNAEYNSENHNILRLIEYAILHIRSSSCLAAYPVHFYQRKIPLTTLNSIYIANIHLLSWTMHSEYIFETNKLSSEIVNKSFAVDVVNATCVCHFSIIIIMMYLFCWF